MRRRTPCRSGSRLCALTRARPGHESVDARSILQDHHPAYAEAVGDHAETLREEGLAERHAHLPAVRQRREHAVGMGLVAGIEREREALEFWAVVRAAV